MKLIQTQCWGKCPNCVGNKYLLQAVCLISRVLRYIIFAWIGRDVPFEKVQEQRPECDALGLSTRSHALGQLCLHHLDSSTDTWLGKNPLKPQIVGHSIMKRRPSPRTLLRSCEQWGGFTKTRGWPLRVSMGPWYVFVMYVCIYIYTYGFILYTRSKTSVPLLFHNPNKKGTKPSIWGLWPRNTRNPMMYNKQTSRKKSTLQDSAEDSTRKEDLEPDLRKNNLKE